MNSKQSNEKKIPKHIAVILDGNNRWSRKNSFEAIQGYRQGIQAVKKLIKGALEQKIEYLTLFAFSKENWQRPKSEVISLMSLLDKLLNDKQNLEDLNKNGVKISWIGDSNQLKPSMIRGIKNNIETTKNNTKLNLAIALNYSGKWDIENAMKNIAYKIKSNDMQIEEINEQSIAEHLSSHHFPDPDLLIRTCNELRISNFLLWQIAYTELYFAEVLWPDFTEKDLELAVEEYSKRNRKFGRLH